MTQSDYRSAVTDVTTVEVRSGDRIRWGAIIAGLFAAASVLIDGCLGAVHARGVFRLLHALDDGWEPYFLDTVLVPEDRTVRIAFVADTPGRWLLASTILERFDAGLWTWIEVT